MEVGISLLLKFLPYLTLLGVGTYIFFRIEGRGARREREKLEKAQAETQAKVSAAEGKDAAIDARVRGQVEEIRKAQAEPVSGDKFKF